MNQESKFLVVWRDPYPRDGLSSERFRFFMLEADARRWFDAMGHAAWIGAVAVLDSHGITNTPKITVAEYADQIASEGAPPEIVESYRVSGGRLFGQPNPLKALHVATIDPSPPEPVSPRGTE